MAIRVVLADDEPLIVKGLRKLIPWETFGMEIAGHAFDGRELLRRIEEENPELVVSDICMPHLSGIDMIKELKNRGSSAKIIFISAYQEFAYARDAVAFGAVDYIVKPVVREQLEKAVAKAADLILAENEEVRLKDKLRLLESKTESERMREWLEQLADGLLSPETEAFRALLAKMEGPLYTIAVVEPDEAAGTSDRWPAQERKLIEFAVENVLNELVRDAGRGQVFRRGSRHVVVATHRRQDEAIALMDDIREKINLYLKLSVSIGVGLPVGDAGRLADSRNQAEQALKTSYFEGKNKVLVYREIASGGAAESELFAVQQDIVRRIGAGDWAQAKQTLERLLELIRAAAEGNPELAVSTAFSSVLFIVQELKKHGVSLDGESFDMQGLQSRLGGYPTFGALSQGVRERIETLIRRIETRPGNREKPLMARIKAYIEEHYAEELTLESVAAIAFMNPYYFSSFFKKHTNRNFKAYVTEIRMNRAAWLLAQTDLMVYEIAERVGYQNARHFSDTFKKTYGKLPNEYKQSLKK
ncbi:response regulator [Cohnella algarum]|uniref:response regulator n=1 Tax=Cohnella algarum TaxID=2044859 RepID=UPI001966D16B|nr:response regulator [Cohnella algarum]MBN2983104.1 response regulator [Cohnella algarum]